MLEHPLLYFLAACTATMAAVCATSVHHLKRYRRRHAILAREKEVVYGFVQDMGEVFTEAETAESAHLFRQVLHYALRTTRGCSGAIYLRGEKGGLSLRCSSGLFPPPYPGFPEEDFQHAPSRSTMLETWLKDNPPSNSGGVLQEIADSGRAVLIAQADGDPRIPARSAELLRIDSFLAVPMRFQRKVIGLVAVANRVDGLPFRRGDLNLLQTLADQASVSIHYASLRDQLEEKRKMEHELDVAQEIQASLLPKTLPTIPGFEMAAFSRAARKVGGDYYDVIRVDDDHIGIVIADVAGKSVGGAILMAACRNTLRALAPGNPNPADALVRLNDAMRDTLVGDPYITMVYAVLDIRRGRLHLVRAGHEAPCLLRAGADGVELLTPSGIAVGMGETEDFAPILEQRILDLAPGDTILFYTDGIPEAHDPLGSEWGRDTFFHSIPRHAGESASALVNRLQQEVLRFRGGIRTIRRHDAARPQSFV
jgi:sigma-B regulation protein RsbU (phosphoserine phosphatase)